MTELLSPTVHSVQPYASPSAILTKRSHWSQWPI